MKVKLELLNQNVAYPGCGNTYRSHISLANHIANVYEKIPCSICGEMISKKRETRHFQQKHTSDSNKKFKCKFCVKGFVETSRLCDHINTHTSEKPYVLANFAGLLMLVMEIIESTKEDIWDTKDQSEILIKNLKSKNECGDI